MLEVIVFFIVLLILAWAANQFLPHPLGLAVAVVLVIIALLWLADVGDFSFRDR